MTDFPAACKTCMAGSANVAKKPRTKAKVKMIGKIDLWGSLTPTNSLRGMRPKIRPSIKNVRPAITSPIPMAMIDASTILIPKITV